VSYQNCGGVVHYRGSSSAYNPWNPMEEDVRIFMAKYPKLKTWRVPYCPYSFAEPFFCRSWLYRLLLRTCALFPIKSKAAWLVKHCMRLEPLFHRI
jgi:hypothetical protein